MLQRLVDTKFDRDCVDVMLKYAERYLEFSSISVTKKWSNSKATAGWVFYRLDGQKFFRSAALFRRFILFYPLLYYQTTHHIALDIDHGTKRIQYTVNRQ